MPHHFTADSPTSKNYSSPQRVNTQKILDSLVDVICVLDKEGIFHYVSPSCTHLFGYNPEDLINTPFARYIYQEDRAKTELALLAHKPFVNFENRFMRSDGEMIPLLWTGKWSTDDGLLYCVAKNGAEKSEIEKRLNKAQEIAKVANYEFDVVKGTYTHTSDTIFDIFGISKKEHPVFTSELFWSRLHPDDVEHVKGKIRYADHLNADELEYRIVRPGGKVVYLRRIREVVRDSDGNPIKTVGILQDISDRKTSEITVQQSEERFRSLVQNGNDLIGIVDKDGNYTFVSSNVKEQIGYSAEELVGKSAFQFIHPEDVRPLTAILGTMVEQVKLTIGPFRYKNGRGEWRWLETTVSNHLQNPAILGLVVNAKDITEKKQKEDELRLSEQRFKALVENGSDLIIIIDDKANFRYISDNVNNVLGYSPGDVIGRNAFDFIHPDDAEGLSEEINHLVAEDGAAKGVQHRFQHKDGSWIWLESKGVNHQGNQSIRGILVNSRNIDDRVKLQERLNAELMNKQREITSAVIKAQETERSQLGRELHDNVNQVLTTVKLYNEMYVTGYLQDKELLRKSTQYTQDCINEIRSISKRLSAPTLGNISLHDSINELVSSINLTKRLDVAFHSLGLDTFPVSEDLHLAVYRIVQEGLNNILKYSNANEAHIRISCCGTKLCLQVSDNGDGFDPKAKKSGIGITNMKTRAENLNGSFTLNSAPGKGCEIQICFPYTNPLVKP
jgi:PAS domain S-box-containing protein